MHCFFFFFSLDLKVPSSHVEARSLASACQGHGPDCMKFMYIKVRLFLVVSLL